MNCETCLYRDTCEIQNANTCKDYTEADGDVFQPLNRQAMFRTDGSMTSVPTRLTEQPRYKQLNLF